MRRRLWSRSGMIRLDEPARDLGDPDVGLLRQLAQPVERFDRIDLVTLL